MIDLGDKGHYTFLYQRNLSAWQLQIEKQLKLNEVGFKWDKYLDIYSVPKLVGIGSDQNI